MALRFEPTTIPEVIKVTTDFYRDPRGLFCELYRSPEFKHAGIEHALMQTDYSVSLKNVIRGLHYQLNPMAQAKIVSVVAGVIFDVAVDLRKGAPTYGRWTAVELKPDDACMLFIPEGFAHGFCTLSDEARIIYHCSQVYSKEHERGIRWDDPQIGIQWPVDKPLLSKKDAQLPLLAKTENNFVFISQ